MHKMQTCQIQQAGQKCDHCCGNCVKTKRRGHQSCSDSAKILRVGFKSQNAAEQRYCQHQTEQRGIVGRGLGPVCRRSLSRQQQITADTDENQRNKARRRADRSKIKQYYNQCSQPHDTPYIKCREECLNQK